MLNIKKRLDGQSKLLIKNSGWVFFSNFFSTGLAFIRSVVIARGLGPEIFGTYAMIVSFVGLIQEFLNLNVGTALIKFGAVFHAEKRNDKLLALVKGSLYISIIMALISVIVIAILCTFSYSTFIKEPNLEWFVIWYAVAASITYVNSISKGLLRLYYKFRVSSLIQMIMDVIETGAIAIAVFFYPKDLNIFFVAIIITRLMNGAICNILAYYELRRELNPYIATPISILNDSRKSIFGFIFGNSVGNSLKTVITQGDVLLLGLLSNSIQVGYYSVAKKLAYSVLTLTDPLTQSIYPQLSKLIAAGSYKEIRRMLVKITSIAMIPGIVFLLVTYFLNKWIIVTVYGIDYAPASDSFYYFLIGAVLGAATFWTLPLIQSLGIVTLRIKIYIITIFLGSSLAYLLVPSMHNAGMSLALLITNILNLVIFVYVADQRLKGLIRLQTESTQQN